MLLDLPTEIRLKIFFYLFQGTTFRALSLPSSPYCEGWDGRIAVSDEVVVSPVTAAQTRSDRETVIPTQTPILTWKSTSRQLDKDKHNSSLALYLPSRTGFPHILTTSHQLYHEAAPVFYSTAKFHFQYYCYDLDDDSNQGHNTDNINNDDDSDCDTEKPLSQQPRWPLLSILTSFTPYHSLIKSIYYTGTDPTFLDILAPLPISTNTGNTNRSVLFPRLSLLELDLGWDHYPSDQTNWDRAVKYALRDRGWRRAIEDAIRERIGEEMRVAVRDLRRRLVRRENSSNSRNDSDGEESGETSSTISTCHKEFHQHKQHEHEQQTEKEKPELTVVLIWKLGYRFVEFEGQCELLEWVLRVSNPESERGSEKVYEVRQVEME